MLFHHTFFQNQILYYNSNWQPHKPSFFSKKELIKIGHRGIPLLDHENTVSSFIKAVEANIDGIELDVQFSSDKQLIVYHDWICEALIGPVKSIVKTPYSELKKIRFNNKNINKIPLLTEALDVLPEKYIKIPDTNQLIIIPCQKISRVFPRMCQGTPPSGWALLLTSSPFIRCKQFENFLYKSRPRGFRI